MIRWEFIPDSGSGELSRAPIFGGWLVRYVDTIDSPAIGRHDMNCTDFVSSITFVPDAEHTWRVAKEDA